MKGEEVDSSSFKLLVWHEQGVDKEGKVVPQIHSQCIDILLRIQAFVNFGNTNQCPNIAVTGAFMPVVSALLSEKRWDVYFN